MADLVRGLVLADGAQVERRVDSQARVGVSCVRVARARRAHPVRGVWGIDGHGSVDQCDLDWQSERQLAARLLDHTARGFIESGRVLLAGRSGQFDQVHPVEAECGGGRAGR